MNNPVVLVNRALREVLVLTLNRPEVLNALNQSLLVSLQEQVRQIAADTSIRVLIITGAGGKAFCAGADLKERKGMGLDETRAFVKLISETFEQVAALPIPTIAAINGVAFGGGLELALACDMRVMDEHSRVGLTECALGIIPGAGGTQRLPRIVGEAKAKELILAARRVGADEGQAMGLVNQVAKGEKNALEMAMELASQIAQCAPLSVRSAKKAIVDGAFMSKEQGLRLEAECYESILHSKDRVEGLRAFAEKREPQYLGC